MSDPFRAAVRIAAPAPLAGRRPRVLAYVHNYPPNQNAGAEWMLHELLLGCRARGLDVAVLAARVGNRAWDFEGIPVTGGTPQRRRSDAVGWSDVVVTHLDMTREAVTRARAGGRPVVHVVHNHRQLDYHRVTAADADLVVYNSQWIADLHDGFDAPSIVVRPPVDPARHRSRPGRAVTLVNLNAAKGGALFWRLARRLPGTRFLGVRGGYGDQIGFPLVMDDRARARVPANVTLSYPTADMRQVWRRTRVLIVPSGYESWGRVAVEAFASGIPVVAHPTPGLVESMGDAAIFVDLEDEDGWVDALARLADPAEWAAWSRRALARSAELDPTPDLDAFAAGVHALLPSPVAG